MGEPRPGEWMVVTAAEQRRIDALAVECGTPEDALVESAGVSAADWILRNTKAQRVVVFAGPGGNGADALVVARCLRRGGINVESFLLSPEGMPSRSVTHALKLLRDEGSDALPVDAKELSLEEQALSRADLVVDGLYGSGLSRPLEGVAAQIVRRLNGSGLQTVSLDVPSGVAAGGGDVCEPAVHATVTLAMEYLKPAHLFFPAAGMCGRTDVVRVAYPKEARAAVSPWARVLSRDGVRRRLPTRPPVAHKGTFGHVLLVAGSTGMVGAAILAGRGALRAGLGLLTIGIPASQAAAVHVALPEALVVPLAEDAGHIVPAAVADLDSSFRRATLLAIGPGLSRDEETCEAALAILRAFGGRAVVDADALYALSRHPEDLQGLAGRAILTPHPGEFATLTGSDVTEADCDRVAAAP
ncbi:MAG: NAD(P)H-hydrate epimerase, partial [Candidatus Bipolaricaulota bacterium]|nr:NAD(P)H-hydrate epimerase [Candidatus Bipolaricaulota bacterium]